MDSAEALVFHRGQIFGDELVVIIVIVIVIVIVVGEE